MILQEGGRRSPEAGGTRNLRQDGSQEAGGRQNPGAMAELRAAAAEGRIAMWRYSRYTPNWRPIDTGDLCYQSS